MSARPLRIVHCFRSPTGGLFRHVRDLAEAQHHAGHMVGVVCDATIGGPLEESRLAALTPVLALGLNRVPMKREIAPSDMAATIRIMREIRALNPDVLHAHGAKGGVYARIAGTLLRVFGMRVARIYTPHGGSLHYSPTSLGGRVYFAAERLLGRMTDAFIFISQYEADTYAAKVGKPSRLAKIVYNGLRPEEFEPVSPAADASDFLYVGTFREIKGPDVFVEALALIREQRGTTPTATMIGDGDVQPYQAMAAERGLAATTRFLPATPIREAFTLGRVMVVPSRAESLPYTVLETIAAHMPLVTTRVGGIPEIFTDESDHLVPPSDAPALASAMRALSEKPESAYAFADQMREAIRDRFSVAAMTAGIESVYREVTLPDD